LNLNRSYTLAPAAQRPNAKGASTIPVDYIDDYSDERNKSWCIHCGIVATEVAEINRDHVPSKSLLKTPYPTNLPRVPVCKPCNEGFSLDEEYFCVLVNCILSGSTDPEHQNDSRVGRILSRSHKLRARIENAKVEQILDGGKTRSMWQPETERVNRVILKNARGHVLYEFGEPMLTEPTHVWSAPLQAMTAAERFHFERAEWDGLLPEVGSRMLTRVFSGQDLVDGWVQVQDGIYRYVVSQHGLMRVRTVIADYLATEVYWSD